MKHYRSILHANIKKNYCNEYLKQNNKNKLFSGINKSKETFKNESRYFSRVGKGEPKNSSQFIALNLHEGNRRLTG